MLHKIGMRNIKTAVAVYLCLYILEFMERDAVLAGVAAIICMQPTVESSLEQGVSRVLGTVMGGFVGVIFLYMVNWISYFGYSIERFYIYIIPIGIILIIQTCVLMKQTKSVSIGCIVYLTIMMNQKDAGDYFWYPINRTLDTIFGIAIAILVNKYLKKPSLFNKNKREIDTTLNSNELNEANKVNKASDSNESSEQQSNNEINKDNYINK